jgi:hypothetical protein
MKCKISTNIVRERLMPWYKQQVDACNMTWEALEPLTNKLGLSYINCVIVDGKYNDEYFLFRIIDKELFFLAAISHGIAFVEA